jgi:hypothetical protein
MKAMTPPATWKCGTAVAATTRPWSLGQSAGAGRQGPRIRTNIFLKGKFTKIWSVSFNESFKGNRIKKYKDEEIYSSEVVIESEGEERSIHVGIEEAIQTESLETASVTREITPPPPELRVSVLKSLSQLPPRQTVPKKKRVKDFNLLLYKPHWVSKISVNSK